MQGRMPTVKREAKAAMPSPPLPYLGPLRQQAAALQLQLALSRAPHAALAASRRHNLLLPALAEAVALAGGLVEDAD